MCGFSHCRYAQQAGSFNCKVGRLLGCEWRIGRASLPACCVRVSQHLLALEKQQSAASRGNITTQWPSITANSRRERDQPVSLSSHTHQPSKLFSCSPNCAASIVADKLRFSVFASNSARYPRFTLSPARKFGVWLLVQEKMTA